MRLSRKQINSRSGARSSVRVPVQAAIHVTVPRIFCRWWFEFAFGHFTHLEQSFLAEYSQHPFWMPPFVQAVRRKETHGKNSRTKLAAVNGQREIIGMVGL